MILIHFKILCLSPKNQCTNIISSMHVCVCVYAFLKKWSHFIEKYPVKKELFTAN